MFCRLSAVAVSALLVAGCASSPEMAERQRAIDADIDAILSEPLDEDEYGTSNRCLSDNEYHRFHALDDRHILFEGLRGRQWINTLRSRCPDLEYGTILRVRSYSSPGRICARDTFVADEWFTWPWYRRWPWHWGSPWGTGMTCTLGEFQPVTDEQVEAIEEILGSR